MNRPRESGYSMVELLIVVAMIGIISVVTVPMFISFAKSNEVKSSFRQFTTDLRSARQYAITHRRPVKLSFETGTDKREYRAFEGSLASPPVWTEINVAGTALSAGAPIVPRSFTAIVYFSSSDFEDEDSPADGTLDIIFQPNGSIDPFFGNVVIRATAPKIAYNEYTIVFSPSGNITSTRSKF